MSTSRPLIFTLFIAISLSAGGCKWFRRTRAPQPPPVPVPASTAPQPTPPEPTAPEPSPPQPDPPKPTAPALKPKPKPVPAPVAPPPPAPAFGQILTPQQLTEFRRAYQQSAQFARETLSQLSGRPLSRDQAETANRIRSFLTQADEAQAKDPSVAAQLARRAELLARSLLSSLP